MEALPLGLSLWIFTASWVCMGTRFAAQQHFETEKSPTAPCWSSWGRHQLGRLACQCSGWLHPIPCHWRDSPCRAEGQRLSEAPRWAVKHIYLNIGIHGIDAYFIKSALSRSIRHSLRSMLVLFRYSHILLLIWLGGKIQNMPFFRVNTPWNSPKNSNPDQVVLKS